MCKLRSLGKGRPKGSVDPRRRGFTSSSSSNSREAGSQLQKERGDRPHAIPSTSRRHASERGSTSAHFLKGRPIFANIFTALGPRSGCDSIRTGPWLSLKRQDQLTAPLTPHHCMDAPHRVRRTRPHVGSSTCGTIDSLWVPHKALISTVTGWRMLQCHTAQQACSLFAFDRVEARDGWSATARRRAAKIGA